MGFLDNSSITVDAILTKRGRQILASGGDLNITKFALSDEEVDYTLYDVTHPNGTDSYGSAIENMSLLEATPNRESFRSFLIQIPISNSSINVATPEPGTLLSANTPISLNPETVGGISEQYTFHISNLNVVQFQGTTASTRQVVGNSVDLITRPISSQGTSVVTITGNLSGLVKTFTVSVEATAGSVTPPDLPQDVPPSIFTQGANAGEGYNN